MLFSENLSLIAFIVHVAIVQGTDIINFRPLFFFSVNSTESLDFSLFLKDLSFRNINFILTISAISGGDTICKIYFMYQLEFYFY